MKLKRGSLALRVLVISILAIALPLLLYFVLVYQQEYGSRLRSIVVRLRDLGRDRAGLIETLNEGDLRTIDIIQEMMLAYQGADPDRWLSKQLTAVAKGGGFASAYFVSLAPESRYHVVASSDPSMIGDDFSADRYIEQVMLHGSTAFLAYGSSLSDATNAFEKYFFVAKLVHDQSNKPMGIMTLSTLANRVIQELVTPEQTGYSVEFSLVTGDGIIFSSGDPNLDLHMLKPVREDDQKAVEQLHRLAPGSLEAGEFHMEPIEGIADSMYITWGGTRRIAVEVPIEGTNLAVLLTANEREAFAPQRVRLFHVFGVFLLIFAVGGWAALWLTQRLSRPMQHLCDVMRRVSRGDLTARYRKRRMGFEVNFVGEIFNQTINSLREQVARAETERVQKESLDEEFRIGRDIQMSILPRVPPAFPGVELAARYLPAKQVGGDFYDMFVRRPDELVLTVADASGKGISACLYSLLLRSMLRSFAVTSSLVSETMRKASNLLCEDTGMTGMFVTAFTAIYYPESQELTYTSCGHPPAILVRADGVVQQLAGKGLAMGVREMATLEEDRVSMQSGDLLVMYTDGVTEAHNDKNELFGEQRLLALLQENTGQPAAQLADALLEAITDFRGEAPQYDDITLLLMRALPLVD